jgi:splicing factor 4
LWLSFQFQALKGGEEFDESDYVENKLTNENLGFKMLQRMGWNEGTGLGFDAQGITNPIGK